MEYNIEIEGLPFVLLLIWVECQLLCFVLIFQEIWVGLTLYWLKIKMRAMTLCIFEVGKRTLPLFVDTHPISCLKATHELRWRIVFYVYVKVYHKKVT
jgi:hypothetical protein